MTLRSHVLSTLSILVLTLFKSYGYSIHPHGVQRDLSLMKLSSGATKVEPSDNDWVVYVDQSKASLEKRASTTLDAFIGLTSDSSVKIQPAVFKSKTKGPLVRCISKGSSFEVSNVDSVDKVYRILSTHMGVSLSLQVCNCLKWKYQGNGHLEAGEIDLAIEAYNKALETGVSEQKGIVLLMRATANLQRAAIHKAELKEIVNELIAVEPSTIPMAYQESMKNPSLANAIFLKISDFANRQEDNFKKTQYHHGLYQYALLNAAQDALLASELLPAYDQACLRVGEILSELWRLKESAQYYERAVALNPSLESSLRPVIDRLRIRQESLDTARAFGWAEDVLRLALDYQRA